MVNSVFVKYCHIVYNLFLVSRFMEEKKQNDLDVNVEAENSNVSCSSCPFDVMTQKILGLFKRK